MHIIKTKSNFKAIFNYLKSDLQKKKRAFVIGLITVFLVVFFICLLMNTLSIAPAIFIRLSENQVGEIDITMLPYFNQEDVSKRKSAFERIISQDYKDNKTGGNLFDFENFPFQFLNFTEMHQRLEKNEELQGITPRWIIAGNITNLDNSWALSNIIVLNSRLETKYGLGRKLNLKDLNSFVNFCNLGMLYQ